ILPDTDIRHVVLSSIADQLPIAKGLIIKTVLKLKGLVPKHHLKIESFKDALRKGAALTLESVKVDHEDIAILQYTGGTTGSPKGALLTQANVLANMVQIETIARSLDITSEEVVLTALPLYHIFALSVTFLAFLAGGSETVLVPKPIPIENT